MRSTIEKTEEGRIKFQNKRALVPRKEGATVAATPTFSSAKQCGPSRAGRTGSVPTETFNFTGRSHKIPQMSYLRYETPAFLDKYNKDADESEKQTKTQECNK